MQLLPALVEMPADGRTVPYYTLTIPKSCTLPVHWRYASQQVRALLELQLKSCIGPTRPLANLIHRFASDPLLVVFCAEDERQAWWWLLQEAGDFIREEEGLTLNDDLVFDYDGVTR
jgi:hypothetical protein